MLETLQGSTEDKSMRHQGEAAENRAHHQRVAPHGSPPGGAGFSRRPSRLRARRSAVLKSSRKLFAAVTPLRAAMMHICTAACVIPLSSQHSPQALFGSAPVSKGSIQRSGALNQGLWPKLYPVLCIWPRTGRGSRRSWCSCGKQHGVKDLMQWMQPSRRTSLRHKQETEPMLHGGPSWLPCCGPAQALLRCATRPVTHCHCSGAAMLHVPSLQHAGTVLIYGTSTAQKIGC